MVPVPKIFVYYNMEIILKIKDSTYVVAKDIDNPDTDNIMYGIECLVKEVPGISIDVMEEYIIAWAEEIQNKRIT